MRHNGRHRHTTTIVRQGQAYRTVVVALGKTVGSDMEQLEANRATHERDMLVRIRRAEHGLPLADAVMVDPVMPCVPNPRWRWRQSCHMFVDIDTPLDMLHKFARRLRLQPAWFQESRLPHYDLTAARRRDAVKLGAVEVSAKTMVMIRRLWKAGNEETEARSLRDADW